MARKSPDLTDKHVGSMVRMRRKMLDMSQEKLGDALGLTFQQVQKYEKGTNRISASRLQNLSGILHVPVTFFFEGLPDFSKSPKATSNAPTLDYVSEFITTSDGLRLIRAFTRIKNSKLRRDIVRVVEAITDQDGN